jgi:hypothetical protein
VFDIDETLIQYINTPAYKYWEEASPEQKRSIENSLEYEDIESKRKIIFLRPGLKQFLEMAKDSGRIKVAIWTYSERQYAKEIAELICKKYGLPQDTFIFKYGAEDIDDDDIPKSMQQIWDDPKFGKKFNKFNTFIVDDRYGNLCHKINRYNSVLVQAFAPFGETKQREPLTDHLLEKAINDDIFHELTEISKKLLKDIDGCEDEDIDEAFKVEAVFSPKCMKRKGLNSYVKEYADGIHLCTIGEVENAASSVKGGRRRRSRRVRSRSRRVSMKNGVRMAKRTMKSGISIVKRTMKKIRGRKKKTTRRY